MLVLFKITPYMKHKLEAVYLYYRTQPLRNINETGILMDSSVYDTMIRSKYTKNNDKKI